VDARPAGGGRRAGRWRDLLRAAGGCRQLPADRCSDDAVAEFHARLDELDARVVLGSWVGERDRVFRLDFGNLSASELSTALNRAADARASAVE
jgi:hypothetical protein